MKKKTKPAAVKPSPDPIAAQKGAKSPKKAEKAKNRPARNAQEVIKPAAEGQDKGKKPKIGRPSIFTQDIANEFCARVANGEPVRQIALLDHMPEERTFYRWLAADEAFCQKYARAKEIQAERFAEELTEIADNGTNDWIERENERTGEKYVVLNDEAISRSRLRVETRKWLMGKFKPKKYGDKIDVDHGVQQGNPLETILNEVAGIATSRLRPTS